MSHTLRGATTPPQSHSGLNLGCGNDTTPPVRIKRVSADPEGRRGGGGGGGGQIKSLVLPSIDERVLPSIDERPGEACCEPMPRGLRPRALIKLILGGAEKPSACDEQQRLKNCLGRDPWLQGGSSLAYTTTSGRCARPPTNNSSPFVRPLHAAHALTYASDFTM